LREVPGTFGRKRKTPEDESSEAFSDPSTIRPFVVGRRGWLFSDTAKGAKASAVVYSIVETAKANNLNVYMYLVHIFSKMPGLEFKADPALLHDFMPWSQKIPGYCRNSEQ